MKFIVQRNALLEALSITGKAIGKSVIPILDNYRFKITGKECTVIGSNMEIFICRAIDLIEEAKDMDICIDSKKLLSLIKELADQPLTFDVAVIPNVNPKFPDALKITIISNSGKYSISGEQGRDFPTMPTVEGEVGYFIDAELFKSALEKTLFSIDPNITKEGFKYMLIDSGNGINIVGCDVRVMAVNNVFENTVNINRSLVSKNSMEVLKSINPKGEINLLYGKKNLSFVLDENTEMTVQLMDEVYPQHTSAYPNTNKTLTVNCSEMIKAVKRVSLFSGAVVSSLLLDIQSGKLKISSENTDYQESAFEEVNCDYTGDDFRIMLNGDNVIDILSKIETPMAHFDFEQKNKAAVIREEGEFDKNNLFLAMPLMLLD